MNIRYFKQLKTDSLVHHWKWVKSKGLFVAYLLNGSFGDYHKSDYTLTELLDKNNGESIEEISKI